jgi:pimeloyl-ACP methyl ester carboxylesterase
MEPLANTVPYAATSPHSSPLSRAFIRELLLQSAPEGYIANCNVIANAKPPDYKAVKTPLLLIAGEHDKSAPLEGCEHIFKSVGSEKKKMEVLENVGHWHCVEAPDRVGDLVAKFCDEIEP